MGVLPIPSCEAGRRAPTPFRGGAGLIALQRVRNGPIMYNKPMRTFPRETALYLLALVIGLTVRLVGLGSLPLSDVEAGWALQALDAAHGARTMLGANTAYVALTSALFFGLGTASNALARLVPALVGSAMILIPRLFAERIKPRVAVILAFALALEPGLVSLSRQAGSSILAVTFALAAWGFWGKRQVTWAGASAGLALLSGAALWPGLLGFALTWALLRPLEAAGNSRANTGRRGARAPNRPWMTAGAYAFGAVALVGTVFATVPGGLSSWISGLPEYIVGWTRSSGMAAELLPLSLVAYQPLGILLALIASVRGWIQGRSRLRRLSVWMLVAFLIALFYPSRQVGDLAWMLIPVWGLASLELARALNIPPRDRREVLGAVALSVIILMFMWLDFLALRGQGVPADQAQTRAWLLAGSFLLLLISLLLVAVGWSLRIAQAGAVLGLVAFLGLYSMAALVAATGLRQIPNSAEMWRPEAQLPMARLLLSTVQDQSAWSDVDPNAQPVVIAGLDSDALRWLLRDRTVEVRPGAGAASDPPMVITPDEPDSELAATYRGQGFVWRSTPAWDLFRFAQWLPFHEMTRENETVILWVRNDLFPDARPRQAP